MTEVPAADSVYLNLCLGSDTFTSYGLAGTFMSSDSVPESRYLFLLTRADQQGRVKVTGFTSRSKSPFRREDTRQANLRLVYYRAHVYSRALHPTYIEIISDFIRRSGLNPESNEFSDFMKYPRVSVHSEFKSKWILPCMGDTELLNHALQNKSTQKCLLLK